jgi:hypothetical protein
MCAACDNPPLFLLSSSDRFHSCELFLCTISNIAYPFHTTAGSYELRKSGVRVDTDAVEFGVANSTKRIPKTNLLRQSIAG